MFSIPDSVEEENFRGARHGDAFFVPEIEVAVTPARLDVKDVTVEVFYEKGCLMASFFIYLFIPASNLTN